MNANVPPAIPCPTCSRYLSVVDTECWCCERVFGPRELWELYESYQRGLAEATTHHR